MNDNHLKTPLAASLDRHAANRINDYLQITGKSLPCTVVSADGGIVTVNFEISSSFTLPRVTVPVASSEYIRLPIQPGMKGFVVPADARLGAMSGLGSSTATLAQPGNLAALVFVPIGNKNWSSVDGNVLVMYGPDGVTIRDQASNTTFVLTASGVTVTRGSVSLVLDNSGVTINGDLTVTGNTSFGGGAKKVVLDGDPVIGGGGGTVRASSTTIKAT